MHYLTIFIATVFFIQQIFTLPVMTSKRGYSIQLQSETSFCSFLPPQPGDDVGGTEDEGVPFCSNTSLGSGSQTFPNGFIVSAHYVKTDSYVQVTGKMNRNAYSLSSSDGGGQYDYKDISGVTCNGYKYFVNMLEPDANQYCIRCCESASDCDIGQSTYGCETIIPGNYN